MAVPLQIAYRDVDRSDALDALVENEAAKLERYFGHILHCRVTIEHMHRRHHTGAPFLARVDLSVPGQDIHINQAGDVHDSVPADDETPTRVHKHQETGAQFKDPVLAVRSAFRRARRKLQDYVRLLGEPVSRYS